MDRALTATLGFVVAVVLVLALAAVVLTVRGDDADRPAAVAATDPKVIEGVSFPAIDHDPAAAADLVEVWERWRNASFVSIGTWTRTIDGITDPLTGDVYTAQDPPRRLSIRLGAVAENIEGLIAACSPAEDDEVLAPTCVRGEDIGYGERVAAELALVEQYVGGPNRLYDVATDGGCFQAELIGPALASPWGSWAEFCFDDESGALRLARIRRPSAIDLESIHTIRTEVSAIDFEASG
jgi:hypothetical protein